VPSGVGGEFGLVLPAWAEHFGTKVRRSNLEMGWAVAVQPFDNLRQPAPGCLDGTLISEHLRLLFPAGWSGRDLIHPTAHRGPPKRSPGQLRDGLEQHLARHYGREEGLPI